MRAADRVIAALHTPTGSTLYILFFFFPPLEGEVVWSVTSFVWEQKCLDKKKKKFQPIFACYFMYHARLNQYNINKLLYSTYYYYDI